MGWVKERCRWKRYYPVQDRQRTDPVASHAQKTIASRFYQLQMNKAPIGPYLAEVGQAADDSLHMLVVLELVWSRAFSNPGAPLQALQPLKSSKIPCGVR
jgi:hypothetical protein